MRLGQAVLAFAAAGLLFAANASGQTDLEQRCAAGDGEDAVAACSDIIGTGADRDVSWAYFDRGRAYVHGKLYASAISDFTEFLRFYPRHAGAFTLRARAFLGMDDYSHAIDDFDSAAELQPASADALREACWARAASDRGLDGAVDDCTKALALRPGDPAILETRCLAQLRNKAYAAAIADCSAALERNPLRASALYLRGLVKKKTGLSGGDRDIAASTTLDPDVAADFAQHGIKP
jgi:tetratricopeptide (TPR) repeat protein